MGMQIRSSVSCYCHIVTVTGILASSLAAAERPLKGRELSFDIAFDLPALDDVFSIAAKEVVDGLHSDADRA